MADIDERSATAERMRVRLDRWVTLSCVVVALALAIEHARARAGADDAPPAASQVEATASAGNTD